MSELKATRIKMVYNGEIYEDFGTVPCTQLYYRKEEADKVIAEKDADIQRLEKLCESYRIDCDNLAISNEQAKRAARTLLKKMNHNKYKRCLAMAKWCGSSAQLAWDHAFSYDKTQYAKRALFCEKWRNSWLEIAEKFKEAK